MTNLLNYCRIKETKQNKREKKEKDMQRFQALEKDNAERLARLERRCSRQDEDGQDRSRNASRERLDGVALPTYDQAIGQNNSGDGRG